MAAPAVGWIGLGGMGQGMAKHLAEKGYQVVVHNRTAAVAEQFASGRVGVTVANRPADLPSRCIVTFSSLSNDAALEAVFTDYLSGCPPDAGSRPAGERLLFVDTSTVLPSTSTRLANMAAERGVMYCACPVFGRPPAAAAGSLMAVLSGGDAAVRARVMEVVPAFAGRRVWDLGDDPAAASTFKLCGNFYIVGQVELAAECLTLAAKAGLPEGPVVELLSGIAENGIVSGYVKRIAEQDFNAEGGFSCNLALKDVGHMRSLARDLVCPLPLADLAHSHLLTAKARHGGDLDWGAVALAMRDAAGMVEKKATAE